jgi:hypothetical protein
VTVPAGVNVQEKVVDAPAARVEAPPVQVGQLFVPVTYTPVILESPVLVSVTVIVTEVPDITVVLGFTVNVVNAVAARITVIVPFVDSPSDGAGWPAASVPDAEAPQFVVSLTVKVQL